jgi:DNA replication protein DnaC
MEQSEIEDTTEQREETCEKHGGFVSRYTRCGSDEWWTDCPRCLERPETCGKHGPFISKHTFLNRWDFWSKCPKCKEEKEREEEERRKREMRAELIASRVRAACIPDRFFLKTLTDYKTTTDGERSALSIAMDYVKGFPDHLAAGRCLVCCGLPGTGKTHLACAIAKSLAQSGLKTHYSTTAELIRLIRATWQPDRRESEDTVLRRLQELDLLVLDEVGVQFGTDAERTQLTEVVDRRYRNMKPTLVVSNCTKDELRKYLGDRIVDRLRENGGKFVIFDWPSRRV